jgi:hypothetical protein
MTREGDGLKFREGLGMAGLPAQKKDGTNGVLPVPGGQ